MRAKVGRHGTCREQGNLDYERYLQWHLEVRSDFTDHVVLEQKALPRAD